MGSSSSAYSGRYQLYLLSYAAPGQTIQPVGVLMFDCHADTLHWRLPEKFDISDAFHRDYLSMLSADIAAKVDEMGGRALLSYFTESLSNVLRISEVDPLDSESPDAGSYIRAAYERYVRSRT
jgi:hypothetical protein